MNSYQYQIGGSLGVDASCYIPRKADSELLEALVRGEFCYVFNCRQMGKSSLRVQVKKSLEEAGMHCVSLDMTNIGSEDISSHQWYKSVAAELWRGFNLLGKVNLKTWWQENSELSPVQQLNYFISDVILSILKTEKIFIFIDEIDSVLSLDFSTDDFFALIRYFYNARAVNPEFKRLSFALFGVATPSELIQDQKRTPFNVGKAIALGGLEFPEVMSLAQGLSANVERSEALVREIIVWTGGQPFLTQKICNLVREYIANHQGTVEILPGEEAAWLDKLVREKVIDSWESHDEPEHLRTIRDRLLRDETKSGRLLGIYRRIWQDGSIAIDNSKEQMDLLLSGLVVKHKARLLVRNPIYHAMFDLNWIDKQLDNLRPYSDRINKWIESNYQDKSRLLQGQAFEDAQAWAKDKILSDLDYRFLTASQELEQQIERQNFEAVRLEEVEARLESQKHNDKRQKILIAALSLALIVASGLGLIARSQYKKVLASEQKIAESQRQILISAIEAIATSSEALFASDQRLEALTQVLEAKAELKKLDLKEPELEAKVERNLRRASYGIQEANRFSGHTGPIWSIDFSPDRKLVLSTSEDRTAKLWGLDGSLIQTFKGHKAGVWAADFSQDQSKIVTASLDRTIGIWNLEGKLLKTLKGHQDRVWNVKYSPQDRMIASASWDKTIKLWTPGGDLITTLEGHRDRVRGINFSSDGKILASASWDKTIKLWDVERSIELNKPVILATLTGHDDAVNDVTFIDDQTIVSASKDGTLIIWDLTDMTRPSLQKILIGHEDRVNSVSYNRETSKIISTSDDKTVKIWSLAGDLVITLNGHSDRVVGLGVSQDGDTIASGGFGKTIRLWKPENSLLKTLEGHKDGVWNVAFSPDDKLVASASRDSTLKLWTLEGMFLKTLKGHRDRVNDVAFHPNDKWLASGSDDRTVKIWNFEGEEILSFLAHNSSVFTLAFSPDGNYLATASDNSEIKIWNLQGKLIKTFSGHQGAVIELVFSPDGKTLASSSRDGTAKLWNWTETATKVVTLASHQDVVYGVVSSPDGQMWATSSWDGTIKLWDSAGKELNTFRGHESEVNQIAFSPNGQTIASAGADKTVRLWDLQGKEQLNLERHTANVWSLDFSSDGKTLVSAGDDRKIIVWNLQRLSDINYFKYGCNWIYDYLKTNPDIEPGDRRICNFIEQKSAQFLDNKAIS